MRVIAGKYRGRVLKGPKHKGLRPTADRVKEALFNIIGAQIIDAALLDLFAGSGAIGIEALSRGALSVVMADENQASIKLIAENCSFLEPGERPRILHLNADRALAFLAKEGLVFDLIFLDPPFEAGLLDKTIISIAQYQLLKPGGLLIAEHPRHIEPAGSPLELLNIRHYGDISITFFKN